jgi:NitT/TauT family transport system ATP-binding protein
MSQDKTDNIIEFDHVSVRFGDFTALNDVSLKIKRGSFVSLVGPSGCGKSTLLNMISGLLVPSAGRVLYGGTDVDGVNTRTGYITQRDLLLPWRTLEGNIGLALELQHLSARDRRAAVKEMIDRVGLTGFEKSYPSQLSGGMRKRATLARTLIYEPETLLLDEPFAAVDAILRTSLHEMLLQLWERAGATVIFVTHDLEEALLLSDQVVVFSSKPGRIVHVEDITMARPRNLIASRTDPQFGETWTRLWSYLGEGRNAHAAA